MQAAAGAAAPQAESAAEFRPSPGKDKAAFMGVSEEKRERPAKAAAAPRPAGAEPPCALARRLAAQGRLEEAETAQRACLASDASPATQDPGLVFLAELLDRQSRFAEADAVLESAHRQFPRSRPLDLYRQQRPQVRRLQAPDSR
jgi:hypothetical protein